MGELSRLAHYIKYILSFENKNSALFEIFCVSERAPPNLELNLGLVLVRIPQ